MRTTSISHQLIAALLALILSSPAWGAAAGPVLPNPGSPSMSRQEQEKLGLQAMSEVYKQMPVLPDSSPITRYVQQLGARLVQQIPQKYTWPYQFHVIAQKDINAFALPGGPIFINLGTIAAAQNEAQLAGVISHEMSHVYMQHSAKAATSTKHTIAEIIGAAGGILGGSVIGDLARAGIQFGAGTLLMKYSREDEAQADAVGAVIMYKAGYNPIELANFFETLNKQGGSPPQFLSDHPNPGNRTAAIEKEIRNWPRQSYRGDTQDFQTAKKDAVSTKAYSAQEIADGAKSGRWARENMQNGAVPESAKSSVAASAASATVTNVSFDQVKPSGQFSELQHAGIEMSYPSNWTASTGQNSVTVAPKAGVSQNAIAYGVVVSTAQDQNASSLDQVAQDLIQNLQQSNPGMRQSGDIRRLSINGADAREVDLTSNSPLQDNGNPVPEHDRLVVRSGQGGNYLYLIFIAPERDFSSLQPSYQKMLDSLRVQ
jgi:Zn-dependent protease with chaperone function